VTRADRVRFFGSGLLVRFSAVARLLCKLVRSLPHADPALDKVYILASGRLLRLMASVAHRSGDHLIVHATNFRLFNHFCVRLGVIG
jgi:hypothetical protein